MPTAKADQSPELLKELQAMPLEAKVLLTQARIDEFFTGYNTIGYGHAYVSFSGGKDSTVLLDIARKRYPEIPAVFSNTGLEYPEIRQFALSHDNVEVVAPKMRFDEVISRYGYPLIGKEVSLKRAGQGNGGAIRRARMRYKARFILQYSLLSVPLTFLLNCLTKDYAPQLVKLISPLLSVVYLCVTVAAY